MAGFEFKQHLHPHAGMHTPLYLSALAHSDAHKLQFTPIDAGALKWPFAPQRSSTYTFSGPWHTRRWKTLLFFYEQIAVLCRRVRLRLHICTHVRVRALSHMGLMRAGVASRLTFLLPSSLWQLWSFLFMHLKHREREGEMREAWIPIIVMYSLADIQLDSIAGVSDATFSCANSESNMSFCCWRICSSKNHINQVICIHSFSLPVYFLFFCSS